MLRPIFDQTTRRDAKIDAPLRRALSWWIDALALDVAETRAWDALETRVAHLFCDAAGEPAHLGAVLLLDGKCYWTHLAVSGECLAFFRAREEKTAQGKKRLFFFQIRRDATRDLGNLTLYLTLLVTDIGAQ